MKRFTVNSSRRIRRRGAALVEGAFVLSVLIVILFTILDLGLLTVRQMALSEGARRVARAAAVRGAKATGHLSTWGPADMEIDGASTGGPSDVLRPILVAMDPAQVSVRLRWPDGDFQTDDRVRVELSYAHQPMMPFVLGNAPIVLTSTSVVRIHH